MSRRTSPNKIFLPNGRQISSDVWNRYRQLNPQTGCVEWTGVRSNIGYGFIGWTTPGRPSREPGTYGQMTTHRVALMLKLGRDIAPGMNANHLCHNKLCCEESHLTEGTQLEKIRDMVRDGITTFGSDQKPYNHKQHGRKYKFTEEEINWCRDASLQEVADRFNMTKLRAASFRHGMRTGYRWLPWPNRDDPARRRLGRPPKALTNPKQPV